MKLKALTDFKGRCLRSVTMAVALTVFHIQNAAAKCGGVDYSWGADALATAHDFTVTMMMYVLYVCDAIAGIVTVISALQIYVKMENGEADTKKDIQTLLGAILFFIGAPVVFSAIFGYRT